MQNNIYDVISSNIKKYRKEQGITQQKLADLCCFSPEFIRSIEAPNVKKSFSLESVFIIAEALDMRLSLLCEVDDKMTKEVNDFYNYARPEFDGYLGNIVLNLKKNSKQYQDILKEIHDIKDKYPIIEEVLYDREIKALSEDEVKNLLAVIDKEDSLQMMIEKELFFKGGREAYLYFRKMGIIEDISN